MTVDQRFLDQIALSRDEYDLVVHQLGREPNELELGMFGALWSEHCGYKNSRPLLRLFPTEGARVLTRAGEENAGAVEIGDGLLVAMKVESHNHPSAIEPFQGAATGVGGIIRDIFAMGARPVAMLDSLRFGPLQPDVAGRVGEVEAAHNRRLFGAVVAGIGWYGNCIGLPTVGGEASFAPTYSGNPLVNAMCVGVAEVGKLVRARADGPGNPLILVGADTGRDGIHGATFASVELNEQSEERRPAVQVGNPFLEKLLMEACLELVQTDWIVGLQDLGAAGLTSASVECAAKSGTGIRIDVSRVPRRESGMTPYEVMLSESQERMLVIARAGCEDRVRDLFAKWELRSDVIGEVSDDGMVRIVDGGREVACIPVLELTRPPQYLRQGIPPDWLASLQNARLDDLPELGGAGRSAAEILLRLLADPNIASKRWIHRQYDHQVMTNTAIGPGEGDAAVLRLKGTNRGIALTTDCNGRYCYLDPFAGGAIAVAEAARNLVCVGSEPLALTDCLNFGNPEKPDVYFQLEQAIRGMAEACRVLSIPVISGNVSLYNETNGSAIYPTPVVGMLGALDDVRYRLEMGFRQEGDLVYLVGVEGSDGRCLNGEVDALGGSEYLAAIHARVAGRPRIDLDLEHRVQRVCLEAARRGLLASAHDCSEGGLAVTLAESCVAGKVGLDASGIHVRGRADSALFGEAQSRIVVSLSPDSREAFEEILRAAGAPATFLGVVGGDRLRLVGLLDLPITVLEAAHSGGLMDALAGPAV
jgi:phosphoribosylformylglycinamidine synthase